MSDAALEAEVARLRDEIAVLKASRAPDMEGFRQLNNAIVENRLGSFIAEKAQPRWYRIAVPTFVVAVLVIAFLVFNFR